ncbi:MAG: hypothetical protein MUF87_21780 [Anaerolineae bacterium]|jgi:hypothetical protein|nr:hypothetical protein [Anaerolineae bacterium]
MKALKHEQRLAQALGFTSDDLEFNQNGIINSTQLDDLRRTLTHKLLENAGIAVVVTLVLGIGTFLVRDYLRLAPWLLSLIVMGPALLIGYSLWQWWWIYRYLRRDQREQTAKTISGRITLTSNRLADDQHLAYSLTIGDHAFPISETVFLTFKNGDPYQIYYAPHTHRILSAVWLADPDLFDTAPYQEVNDDRADEKSV